MDATTIQDVNAAPEAAGDAAVSPIQVRGRSFTAVTLRIVGPADKAFYEALEALMRRTPRFFIDAPLVIDLDQAEDLQLKGDFAKLVRELRARRLTPVGVQGGTAAQGVAAFSAGLVTLRGGRDVALEAERPSRPAVATPEIDRTPPAPEAARAPASRPAEGGAGGGTVLVTEPVRSGQRIHAPEGDLVVVTSVSPGAELVARGSIHVYGPLRGRALAGVDGDAGARIFCQSLQAELIAIAGVYRTSDDLGAEVVGDRVQAFLRDGALVVETIR